MIMFSITCIVISEFSETFAFKCMKIFMIKCIINFHLFFQKILVWLQKREVRLREFTPVGSDFDTIKVQWNQVKVLESLIIHLCLIVIL